MSSRPLPAVALAVLVLLAGAGPAVGLADDPATDRSDDGTVRQTDDAARPDVGEASAQYKVSLDNVTVKTWLIRNSTVRNATVKRVVVRNATTANGSRANVTLSNVSVGRFVLDRARMKNVTARELVIRNKSVLDVPGGSFFDPDVENRTIDRQWTKNDTVTGVVIDRLAVDAAILCGNATLGQRAANASAIAPAAGEKKPDIVVRNGTVGEALVIRGHVSNWSVGSVNRPGATNSTLPSGCDRG